MYRKHKEIFSVKNLFKISLVLYQQFNENIQKKWKFKYTLLFTSRKDIIIFLAIYISIRNVDLFYIFMEFQISIRYYT